MSMSQKGSSSAATVPEWYAFQCINYLLNSSLSRPHDRPGIATGAPKRNMAIVLASPSTIAMRLSATGSTRVPWTCVLGAREKPVNWQACCVGSHRQRLSRPDSEPALQPNKLV
jgi:hypothetical protein